MLQNKKLGRDASNEIFYFLEKKFEERQVLFYFGDLFDSVLGKQKYNIYLNPSVIWIPVIILSKLLGKKNINMALEHEAICYLNGRNTFSRLLFDNVLTYRHYNLTKKERTFLWPALNQTKQSSKISNLCVPRGLICMLAANKCSFSEGENYSLRDAIWKIVNSNYAKNSKLYGNGWSGYPKNVDYSILYRIKNLVLKLSSKSPERLSKTFTATYLKNKNYLIGKYKFCVAIENFSSPDGWVTEKIFDALKLGSIPIVYGSPIKGCEQFCVVIDKGTPLTTQIENLAKVNTEKILHFRENGRMFLQDCYRKNEFTYNAFFEAVFNIIFEKKL